MFSSSLFCWARAAQAELSERERKRERERKEGRKREREDLTRVAVFPSEED
jgi:hypothetical protein